MDNINDLIAIGPDSLKYESYSNFYLSGSTSTGKTNTALSIVLNRHKLFNKPVDKCVYLYKNYQKAFDEALEKDKNIIFVESIEDFEGEVQDGHDHCLIVFDDYLINAQTTELLYIYDWFIRRSHHEKCSTIFQSQLLFGKNLRPLHLNTQYFLLKKNFYETQIGYFFRSLSQKHWRALQEAYYSVVNRDKFATFVVSNHPKTHPKLRFRDFVIPREGSCVFVPKS